MQCCILLMVPNINYTIAKGYYVTANEVYAYTKYFIEKNSFMNKLLSGSICR